MVLPEAAWGGRDRPDDIAAIGMALEATARDAEALVKGLTADAGAWRSAPDSWSVAECLDHLATADRVYIDAMEAAARPARDRGRWRRGPARPGLVGGWFVRSLEPPVTPRRRVRAPRLIAPRTAPPLDDAAEAFRAAHDDVHRFLDDYAAIDLTGVRFANPFVRGVRFSLATGLHVIAAHERRHLWQAWNVRHAAEASGAPDPTARA